jgi:hypothetical protein
MLPVSSNGLEELCDSFRIYFQLLVWAPRFWEGASIFSKSPNQVHFIIFHHRITPVQLVFGSDTFDCFRKLGVILSII